MNVETILFALLRMEICGDAVSEEIKAAISPEIVEPLFELSRRHSIAQIVGNALSKLGTLGQDEASLKFRKWPVEAVTFHIRMSHAFHTICNTLEAEKISFIPLKGAVIRQWYPEAWMRTSSDIDILVRPEDHEAAVKCLIDKCECRYVTRSSHDVSLYFPGNIYIEIHHTLIEATISEAQEKVLSGIWDGACLEDGFGYRYRMTDAMFRFYHYAHMKKHIKNGGCGIRPFMDLWIMNHRAEQDRTGEEQLLARGELLAFANTVEKLSQVWFSGDEADHLTGMLAEFILEGGNGGTLKNRLSIRQAKTGGKLQYILYRVFMPYNTMKEYYPTIKKHKWLFPFYQIFRWVRLIFKKDIKRYVEEFSINANTTQKERMLITQLIEELNL